MSDPVFGIVLASAELKLAAPREFDKFIAAFKVLEERCAADLRAAEPSVIFPAQGKAQLVTQLRQKMENCLDAKATIEKRK